MGCSNSKSALKVDSTARATTVTSPLVRPTGADPASSGAGVTDSVVQADVQVAAALRSKRRGVVSDNSAQVDPTWRAPEFPKAQAIAELIEEVLTSNSLFTSLTQLQIKNLVKAMSLKQVTAGETVIVQGDEGDFFYVIESGRYEIIVNGERVAVFGEGQGGRSFGELALLYNSPRAATVQALKPGKLWQIDRATFRSIIAQSAQNERARMVKALNRGVLSKLSESQLDAIADVATRVQFSKGDHIIRKGEMGEVFYIIESGEVICKNLPGGQQDNVLKTGDYVGERALMMKEPRAADVYAYSSQVHLIALHQDDFVKHLGQLQAVLKHNLGLRMLLCMPAFSGMSETNKNRLFRALRVQQCMAGTAILQEGQAVQRFFIVKDGNVAVSRDGVEKAMLTSGQYFGHQELAENRPSRATLTAVTDCELFVLSAKDYHEVLTSHTEHKLELAQAHGLTSGSPSPAARPSPVKRTGGPQAPDIVGTASSAASTSRSAVAAPAPPPEQPAVRQEDLEVRQTLGTGTFGRVKLVVHKRTGTAYALKMLQKAQITAMKQERNVMTEKRLLAKVQHPFCLKLVATYKDQQRLYMLLELVNGGELFNRLQTSPTPGRVPLKHAQFYAACVADALEFLHSRDIVYRDLKPENLLIDAQGYVKVVDFGFAKELQRARTYTLCGTPEYLAPELVLGQGHNRSVDLWALGVLAYEMLAGYSPFADHQHGDQMVICKNILRGQVRFPATITDHSARTFIRALLQADVTTRLGMQAGGSADVKAHPFFRGIDFAALRAKTISAPWIPPVSAADDCSLFDTYDEADPVEPYQDDGSNWDAEF